MFGLRETERKERERREMIKKYYIFHYLVYYQKREGNDFFWVGPIKKEILPNRTKRKGTLAFFV
jgi:hypothetical protein